MGFFMGFHALTWTRMVTRQANIAVEQMQAVGLGNVWSSGGKLFRVVNRSLFEFPLERVNLCLP